MRRFAVELGVNIAAASQQQPAGARDDVAGLVALVIELQRLAARPPDRLEVVRHRATRSDCNHGHWELPHTNSSKFKVQSSKFKVHV
jgi:hypothetical protein